jgi:hypothetical protein
MTPEQIRAFWFKLPLKLRKRYWRETEYGKRPPSAELLAAIREAISNATEDGDASPRRL